MAKVGLTYIAALQLATMPIQFPVLNAKGCMMFRFDREVHKGPQSKTRVIKHHITFSYAVAPLTTKTRPAICILDSALAFRRCRKWLIFRKTIEHICFRQSASYRMACGASIVAKRPPPSLLICRRHGLVGRLTAPGFPCIDNSFLLNSSVKSTETN